eukprot:Tamp_25408.p1 GENE.Tamp_25408~~Tamp_25408.p1  ORF type:complete len:114 (-),score=12.64 Tamp_25408:111-452(-)
MRQESKEDSHDGEEGEEGVSAAAVLAFLVTVAASGNEICFPGSDLQALRLIASSAALLFGLRIAAAVAGLRATAVVSSLVLFLPLLRACTGVSTRGAIDRVWPIERARSGMHS